MFDLNEPASEPLAEGAESKEEGSAAIALPKSTEAGAFEECRGQEQQAGSAAAASGCSSWPRSERPSLDRSASFHLLFSDRPPSASPTADNGNAVDEKTKDETLRMGSEELALNSNRDGLTSSVISTATLDRGDASSRPGKNLSFDCEFLQLKTTNESTSKTTKTTTTEDLGLTLDPHGSTKQEADGTHAHNEEQPSCIPDNEPLLEDSKFKILFWRGEIKFNSVTVTNLVAGCTRDLQHVFMNRRVASELTVQRFAGTDKFLSAVKQYMAEPCVRVVPRSGAQSQNVNKLVQALAGGEDFLLQTQSEGPSVAIIPVYDEAGVWVAELYLVTGSILSEAEPGELDVSDEDVLYGFLSFSADTNESFIGLKDANRMEVDTPNFLERPKKQIPAENAPVDKRGPASSDVSADNKDLEEGQLLSEEPALTAAYEKRKRHNDDEKRGKVNGDNDSKAKDKYRHIREHERDDRDRSRRDREGGDHRDRDFYRTKPAVYDYIPRLDKSRYRDPEKDRGARDHRDMHWESGERRGGSRERRSRSREREKDRNDKAFLNKELTRSKSCKERGKLTLDTTEKGLRKRDRSPVESVKGSGKRLKDGNNEDRLSLQGIDDIRTLNADSNGDSKRRAYCPTFVGVSGSEVYSDLVLDAADQDTRSWLLSKQHAAYVEEEYGVILTKGKGADVNLEDPLRLNLSVKVLDPSDVPEAQYYVHHAADMMKTVAQHGIFCKSLWYPGPVQTSGGDAAPAIHLVVKKLKGDDGKGLESIQDATGAMVEVILDADGKRGARQGAKTSVIGLRVKCLRRKSLAEASQQVEALFDQVIAYFAKQMPAETPEADRKPKVLYVSGLPEYASDRVVRAIFENGLRGNENRNTEAPPGFENTSGAVVDVKYVAEEACAFVEFASADLLKAAFNRYMGDKNVFCGLTVELPSAAALNMYTVLKHGNVKPLYLTELTRNATSESIQQLFEDIITTHINPGLTNNNGLVLDVRDIPSRGCMFVDLATPELVEFMLDLYNRKPEVFGHMKMELGRVEDKKRGGPLEKSRSGRNFSPPPSRRRRADDGDAYDDFHESKPYGVKKQRSDPEKTVYADHLPENSTELVIRRIFERVLYKHMSAEQRASMNEVVTEVRHVKAKFCAFVVFVSEDLARLALELYSKDEDVFEQMRLKPHFNSRLEDMYRDDGAHDNSNNNNNNNETSSRGSEEFQQFEYQEQQQRGGGRRAGGAAFKEVDRRRSVYVDRIPDKYDESAIKEILDRFLKRKGRGSPSYVVSHVSFFRDKYDSSKLCAFVEVKHEVAVQELLDYYAADEDAFDGMRIRPAVKY